MIGEIDDERSRSCEVGGVAAKEYGPGVEPEIEKCVSAGHGGKPGAGGEGGGTKGALVRGDHGGAVRPTVCVGGRVDGEDNVDSSLGEEMGVEGNVLAILTAVDEGEAIRFDTRIFGRVPPLEGVRRPVRNVIVLAPNATQNFLQGRDCGLWHTIGGVTVQLQCHLVEQAAGCAHDKPSVVEAYNADSPLLAEVRNLAGVERGADIFCGSKTLQRRFERAHLPRAELKDG